MRKSPSLLRYYLGSTHISKIKKSTCLYFRHVLFRYSELLRFTDLFDQLVKSEVRADLAFTGSGETDLLALADETETDRFVATFSTEGVSRPFISHDVVDTHDVPIVVYELRPLMVSHLFPAGSGVSTFENRGNSLGGHGEKGSE